MYNLHNKTFMYNGDLSVPEPFGSNIPRFQAKDKIASQTSFKRDGDPTKIGPGHYQKSVTIAPKTEKGGSTANKKMFS